MRGSSLSCAASAASHQESSTAPPMRLRFSAWLGGGSSSRCSATPNDDDGDNAVRPVPSRPSTALCCRVPRCHAYVRHRAPPREWPLQRPR
eukprot:scaffold855_cov344-Prasinococcus_capsulatus_cf.AAC.12